MTARSANSPLGSSRIARASPPALRAGGAGHGDYHPDVSKEKDAEEKFKEMAEAYEDAEGSRKARGVRPARLRMQPGQEFRPSPDWSRHTRVAHDG